MKQLDSVSPNFVLGTFGVMGPRIRFSRMIRSSLSPYRTIELMIVFLKFWEQFFQISRRVDYILLHSISLELIFNRKSLFKQQWELY